MQENVQSIVSRYTDTAVELLMSYGPKLILAVITLILGLWAIRLVDKAFDRGMDRTPGSSRPFSDSCSA